MRTTMNRSTLGVATLVASLGLAACNDILEVKFPGQIPTEQIGDPSLAAVLTRSAISDFECAYSNYTGGSAVHSDEYETANSNIPLANWGERSITADENDYAIGTCEGNFGMNLTLHTARFQAEDTFKKLNGWTDAQVTGRASFMAQVKIYAGYAYLLMGEGFCQVAFDGAPAGPPAAALALAETRFTEGLALAQTAGNTDMLNLGRVGLARAKLDLKKYGEAATTAALVPATYTKNADRGQESTRRHNKLWRLAEQTGGYTVAPAYRNMNDPRVVVADAGRGAFNAEVRLWVAKKYTSLVSPIRLASGAEANLIRAEALIQQDQLAAGMALLNARRAELTLSALVATTKDAAMVHVLAERQKELAFEGGHRLNDLLRFNINWKTGSNPFTNRPYGTTKCWPNPTREVNGV